MWKKLFIIINLSLSLTLWAEVRFFETFSLDLPEGWAAMEEKEYPISFVNPESNTVFQVFRFSGEIYPTAEDLYTGIKTLLKASGDKAPFTYEDHDAVFADLEFSMGELEVKGYFVFINKNDWDYAVLSFSQVDVYNKMHDFLLSALDSFSLGGRLSPGPVSQFYVQALEDHQDSYTLAIKDKTWEIQVSRNKVSTSQVTIEREARILATFPSVNLKAWYRFYRLIYRDNYKILDNLIPLLLEEFKDFDKAEKIHRITAWIQGFEYSRTGTLADFLSPLSTLLNRTGDCDSKVLLLLIILHHMDVDGVLLVSAQYRHSAAGINSRDYPYPEGATVSFEGEKYLYTELTEKVGIGLIPQKMADPEGWIAFSLK